MHNQLVVSVGWVLVFGAGVVGCGGVDLYAQNACSQGVAKACDDAAEDEAKRAAGPGTFRKYCDMGGADACYAAASEIDSSQGENENTAEVLLDLVAKACERGSFAGCNTIGHYAKDAVAACEKGDEIKITCTIAGFVHRRGIKIPPMAGKSYDVDAKASDAAFKKACDAGSQPACKAINAPAPPGSGSEPPGPNGSPESVPAGPPAVLPPAALPPPAAPPPGPPDDQGKFM